MNQKVMIVGLDGGPWALLNNWVSNNKLPTFKRVMNQGSKGILKSTIPCTTFPAIPSMLTGMSPGNLGVFSFINYKGSLLTMSDIEYPKIWNILSNHNYTSCIVNVPATFPPEKLDGIMISGWVPGEKNKYTYPERLQTKIKGFKDNQIEEKIHRLRYKKRNQQSRKKYFDLMIEQTERRYKIFKKLNQEKNYDFSILWIEETDITQHYCWEYKQSLLQLYIKIDEILNDILLSFPNRNIFVVSDHGFESSPEKHFFVNTWLYKQGYLNQNIVPIINQLVTRGQFFAYNYLHRWFLEKLLAILELRKKTRNSKEQCAITKLDNIPGINKKTSKAYLSTMFGIHVNDAIDYETIRDEIIEKIIKIKDENGDNVIRNVWKKEEVFKGKYLKEIPDIVFFTSEKFAPFPALTSKLFGKITRNKYWWQSGEHFRARDGILIACGPAIRKNNDLINSNVEDIFPTILHLLGFEIPKYVDGSILDRIITQVNKPQTRKHELTTSEPKKLNKLDEEKLKDRLRELGYF